MFSEIYFLKDHRAKRTRKQHVKILSLVSLTKRVQKYKTFQYNPNINAFYFMNLCDIYAKSLKHKRVEKHVFWMTGKGIARGYIIIIIREKL